MLAHRAFRAVSLNFFVPRNIVLCPEKFVLNNYHNKKNLSPLTVYLALQTSKPSYKPALCQPTLSNLWHSDSSEFAMLAISVHISFLQLAELESSQLL